MDSRLIGERVQVRVWADQVEIYYGGRSHSRMPRLRGEGKHRIDYRHVIHSLVRKPGAFLRYRWREDLFPGILFRVAYDELRQDCPATADRQYLKILELAAQEGEQRVREALQGLIERGQKHPFRSTTRMPRRSGGGTLGSGGGEDGRGPLRHAAGEPGGEIMSTGNLIRLRECLIQLHLPAFREHYAAQAALATKESLSYPRFLLSLSEIEVVERHERKIQRLRRISKLPWEKTLTALDRSRLPQSVDRQLTALLEGTFLDRAENVLAFGNPGSGKTHLVCALGQELILLGRRVLFSTCALLVQRLLRAKIDLTLEKELKKLDRFEALIVDDIGYVQQSREEMEVLFTLLAHRYERRSILLTSNLIFSDWERIFKDPLTTAAAIDRLVHHSVILELNVSSYRMERRQGKAAGNHGMRKTGGGQIRANRLIGPPEVLAGDDRRVPAKGRDRTAPYGGRSGSSWIWSTPLDTGASEGELPSGYALTPSPSHSKNNLSFLQKGGPRKRVVSEDGYSSFLFNPFGGDFQLSPRE